MSSSLISYFEVSFLATCFSLPLRQFLSVFLRLPVSLPPLPSLGRREHQQRVRFRDGRDLLVLFGLRGGGRDVVWRERPQNGGATPVFHRLSVVVDRDLHRQRTCRVRKRVEEKLTNWGFMAATNTV